ncbi:hypothetical protein P692DRAFT_20740436, partial [Suillus brevipes Sb2]
ATHLFIALAIQERLLAWVPEQSSRQLVFTAVCGRNNEKNKGEVLSCGRLVEVPDFVLNGRGHEMQDTANDSPFIHD